MSACSCALLFCFFFSSRRRHTRWPRDWSSDVCSPISSRALLADPRVLILDDATSSVDSSTERSIKLALAAAMRGRTTFIIAHRLSTIALADEIVVLDHGRIAARGSHEELLGVSELYAEIVEKGLPDQVFLTRETREREVSGL